jgi:predicted ArsR family transcriptional regulator
MNQLHFEMGPGSYEAQPTLARRTDPATSHIAAALTVEFAGNHADKIIAALKRHGDMTVDEIAKMAGLNSQQVNKRLPELETTKRAFTTGKTRMSASGRPERIWRACA